jgi:hypothetical protein
MPQLTIKTDIQLDGEHWERLEDELSAFLYEKGLSGEIHNDATNNETCIRPIPCVNADMNYETWFEVYNPIPRPDATGNDAIPDCMYEPKECPDVPIDTLWTVVEEDGIMWIESGIRFVNRLGYIATQEPYESPELIVSLD